MCQLLEPLLGDLHKGSETNRWATLASHAQVRTGREMAAAYATLQSEARECSAFLQEELEGPLAVPLIAFGEGCSTGHTRKLIVQQREKLRGAVLSQALQQYPDQTARPVWVFPQFDKLSAAWILATPSAHTFLSSPVFREAMAAHLCLPSPCCQSKVGQPVGIEGATVDVFGDKVMSAKLPFDSWRHRHDDIKVAIVERAHHAKVEVDAEIFGLFRDLVPAVEMDQGGELDTARTRNGKVPDLSYKLPPGPPVPGEPAAPRRHPAQGGLPTRLLAELKVIGAGSSRYPRGSREKAVDRRAKQLPMEYKSTLAAMDRRFHGTRQAQQGPLEQRLEHLVGEAGLQSVVVGRFAEASQHLHYLVRGLAEGRSLHLARTTGKPTSAGVTAAITSSYRRILSCQFVRSVEGCLLARMGHLDKGARDAAGRRRESELEERRVRMEQAAYYAAYVRGQGGSSLGRLAH